MLRGRVPLMGRVSACDPLSRKNSSGEDEAILDDALGFHGRDIADALFQPRDGLGGGGFLAGGRRLGMQALHLAEFFVEVLG